MARRVGNVHHACFERAVWESRKDLKLIRTMNAMMFRLYVEPHGELHNALASVPVPDRFMAGRILRNFESGSGALQNIDNFCFAVEEARTHHKTQAIERGVGLLIIDAMEIQKPFILDGLIVK